jgi:hypothetical protein
MTTSDENEQSRSRAVADSDPDSATSRHGVLLAEERRKCTISALLDWSTMAVQVADHRRNCQESATLPPFRVGVADGGRLEEILVIISGKKVTPIICL